MMGRLFNRIKGIKKYTQEIGLKESQWGGVAINFIFCYLCYGFSAEDYFIIGNGYTLSKYERKRFFTLKKAFWLQKEVNDPKFTHFLENKAEALDLFSDLVSRNWLYAPKSSFEDFMAFVKKAPVFIAKPVDGMCGHGIEKHFVEGVPVKDLKTLYNKMVSKNILLEECLKAHDDIYLGTTALSTFRIYTMLDSKDVVHVLKAKYRVGTGDAITDTDDGCIAYPISIENGIIEGPGINEVLNSKHYYYHPGCEKLVVGMRIPMWNRALEIVSEAAKKIPQVRYIGWDIAITNNSVEIIEGNHNPYHGTFEIMGIERLWWPKLKSLI